MGNLVSDATQYPQIATITREVAFMIRRQYGDIDREGPFKFQLTVLGDAFDTLKALVFDTLDSIVWASSLVEMVHALIRPSLNNCKGQITQEARLYLQPAIPEV